MGSSTVLFRSEVKSPVLHPLGTLLPGSEVTTWSCVVVAVQVPELTLSQPNPPGTMLLDGPVQGVLEVFVK
jgi:hypothetical protein